MDVILLEKIGRLGNLGDKVHVKPGYARNYLYPKSKAVPATKDNLAKFEARRAELEKAAAKALQTAQTRAEALVKIGVVTLAGRASEEGRLYGSFGTKEIADAVTHAGVEINKSEVNLPNGVLRQIGEYEVAVQLHADVHAAVKLLVVAEG